MPGFFFDSAFITMLIFCGAAIVLASVIQALLPLIGGRDTFFPRN